MKVPPELTPPRLGDPITVDGQTAYVKRTSAEHQAAMWNELLADDPFAGPSTGLVVGVSPLPIDGRYELVWVTSQP